MRRHRARLGRVVSDGIIVLRTQRHAGGKAHEGVAVGGIETDVVLQHLFDDEADILRRHRGAAAEDAADAGFVKVDFFAERFKELGRGEHAADFAVFQDHHRLINDVVHVGAGLVKMFVADHLLDPARIQINEVTGTAANVREMFDREPQPARAGGPDHQPVMVSREVGVRQFFRELRVVHLVIVPADALLWASRSCRRFQKYGTAGPGIFSAPRLHSAGRAAIRPGNAETAADRRSLPPPPPDSSRPCWLNRARTGNPCLQREMPLNDFRYRGRRVSARPGPREGWWTRWR